MWRPEDPMGNEVGKVRWELVEYTRGHGLDLGCGPHKGFPHFTGVDNLKDVELFGIAMKPDVVVESCEHLEQFEDESQNYVFSSHLLEHIEDYPAALKEWWRVIKVGGYLILYLPHKDLYPNVGTEGANPDHKHDFRPVDIKNAMREVGGWDLLVDEVRSQRTEYSFFQVFKKRDDNVVANLCINYKKPRKTACVVRYGGFGDMLQASGIFPELKRKGYHVTVMTTPRGQAMIENDPHVDAFFIQDDDQVPNGGPLQDFWDYQSKKFDKWINLSESIEGTLLAIPGRSNHLWPHAMRHKYLDINYHEFTAEIAGLPFLPECKFYATDEEVAKVSKLMDPECFNIVYALSGSSCHKFYAGQDQVIAQILISLPKAHIYLAGDEACKILQAGWENEPRVSLFAGEQTIRETLTLAQLSDCVLGPETGVLNSVGFDESVAKVCLLSHSSENNLTKHWVNSFPIVPVDMDCYPCHQLHYGMKYCREDEETGTAMCQMSIKAPVVFTAVHNAYLDWEERHEG